MRKKRVLYFTEDDMWNAYMYGRTEYLESDFAEKMRRMKQHNIINVIIAGKDPDGDE